MGNLPVHQCVGYTDYSLRQFFGKVSRMTWFDSTLFVITADHTGPSEFPEYQNNLGKFKIPILYYMHGSNLKNRSSMTTQQIDIAPSILDYLNYDNPFYSFGESVFDQKSTHFAVNYFNEIYQYISNNYMLCYSGQKPVSFYAYQSDSLLLSNRIGTNLRVELQFETNLKAIIQQYNSRMIRNTLIPR